MNTPPKDKEFAVDIMNDITTINFTKQEQAKLKSFIMSEISNRHLFRYINQIYGFIGANFANPEKILIIPFIDEKNYPHLNIHKI